MATLDEALRILAAFQHAGNKTAIPLDALARMAMPSPGLGGAGLPQSQPEPTPALLPPVREEVPVPPPQAPAAAPPLNLDALSASLPSPPMAVTLPTAQAQAPQPPSPQKTFLGLTGTDWLYILGNAAAQLPVGSAAQMRNFGGFRPFAPLALASNVLMAQQLEEQTRRGDMPGQAKTAMMAGRPGIVDELTRARVIQQEADRQRAMREAFLQPQRGPTPGQEPSLPARLENLVNQGYPEALPWLNQATQTEGLQAERDRKRQDIVDMRADMGAALKAIQEEIQGMPDEELTPEQKKSFLGQLGALTNATNPGKQLNTIQQRVKTTVEQNRKSGERTGNNERANQVLAKIRAEGREPTSTEMLWIDAIRAGKGLEVAGQMGTGQRFDQTIDLRKQRLKIDLQRLDNDDRLTYAKIQRYRETPNKGNLAELKAQSVNIGKVLAQANKDLDRYSDTTRYPPRDPETIDLIFVTQEKIRRLGQMLMDTTDAMGQPGSAGPQAVRPRAGQPQAQPQPPPPSGPPPVAPAQAPKTADELFTTHEKHFRK